MFRITAHHESERLVLKLEGTLSVPWVREADAYWQAAAAEAARPILVDLGDVLGVDDAGRELLARMHAQGASLAARGCAMRELVREITAERGADAAAVEEGSRA